MQLNPAFSPDGSMIAFNLASRGLLLWVANSDGSNPRQLVGFGEPPKGNVNGAAGPPRWSGDSSQIAFGESPFPCGYLNCDVYGFPCLQGPCAAPTIVRVVVSDGTTQWMTRLTSPGSAVEPQGDGNPVWSPDDHWLVFDRDAGADVPAEGIWRIRDDGTCLQRLAGDLRGTRWSPRDPVWRPGAGSPADACS
jgi:Tol biopolymer transport system component